MSYTLTAIATHLGEDAPKDNEEELIANIIESNKIMMEDDGGQLKRAQHPKGHGCLEATFEVLEITQEKLRVGIFSEPRVFPALIRFSNGAKSEDNHQDGDAHGMAIKLLNVAGKKLLPEEEHSNSHDIVLLDNETFFEGDLEQFSIFNDLTAEIANARRNGEDRLKAVLYGVWLKVFRKIFVGKDILAPALETSDQEPVSPLRAKYWSTTPYLLGSAQAVKYVAVPDPAPSPSELTDGVKEPDGLTARLRMDLTSSDACFDFHVQVQGDKDKHPIEDPTVSWSAQDASSYLIAKIRIPKIGALSDSEWKDIQDRSEAIAFNPWNAPPEHRPLGAINRDRKLVYSELLRLRRQSY